jgi:hypothetical protein
MTHISKKSVIDSSRSADSNTDTLRLIRWDSHYMEKNLNGVFQFLMISEVHLPNEQSGTPL